MKDRVPKNSRLSYCKLYKNIFFFALFFFALTFARMSPCEAGADTFEVHPYLESNVAFWEKVFSEYSTDQCVIHDKKNLAVIYGTIKIKPLYSPGSSKKNKRLIKNGKATFKKILTKLGKGGKPVSSEEQRVAALFGASAGATVYKQATKNLRCQIGQRERFREGLIRSGAYMEEIKRIFAQYNLPEELAYLPHVESSFNYKAYSKFGAAGMWQFTRSTGKRFMKISYTIDERLDPIISTNAAARLLKENYETFKSWPIAITAYNHGANGMKRALRSKGQYERIFKEYKSRLFGFASRNFYSEFLAAMNVAKNYSFYFGEIKMDVPVKTHSVSLNNYVSFRELARGLNMDINTLHLFNPSLRKPVLTGQKYIPKGFMLRVPADKANEWEILITASSADIYREEQKRSRFYRVKKGDTAGKIARKLRVRLKDLIVANNLDRRATVYVNQNLRIPQVKRTPALRVKQELKDNRKANIPVKHSQVEEKKTIVAKVDSAPVVKKEPLGSLKYASNPEIVEGNLSVSNIAYHNNRAVGIIKVEVEETLGHYAEWLNVSPVDIMRLNRLKSSRFIRLNQIIKVPLHIVDKEVFEERRYEFHKELSEDFFANYRIERVKIYKIRRGDNIWTLTNKKFEIPLWLLRRYNTEVDFNSLTPSQKIFVPIVAKSA